MLDHRQLRVVRVALEVSDGAHHLRGVEGVDLARQDQKVGTQGRLDQGLAVIAGGVDDDNVVGVEALDGLCPSAFSSGAPG